MSNKLSVSSIIQLYTKYESIAGAKVKVVGTLAFSECANVPFNMTALAINERVISVKDEDLEQFIGNDTIYHCRAVDPNADGTYSEYIVWDSIVNFEKTKKINQTYIYELNIKLTDTTNVPISQVISGIEKYIAANFSNTVEASISSSTEKEESEESTEKEGISDEQLKEVEAILNKLSSFENRLIPAAEKITNANLSESLDEIIQKVNTVSKNVSIIAQNV